MGDIRFRPGLEGLGPAAPANLQKALGGPRPLPLPSNLQDQTGPPAREGSQRAEREPPPQQREAAGGYPALGRSR